MYSPLHISYNRKYRIVYPGLKYSYTRRTLWQKRAQQ
ncbi:hypothetical protein VPHD148_0051 [Vibrio phage D148]